MGFTREQLEYMSLFFRGNASAMAVGERLVTEIRGNEGQTLEAEVERLPHTGDCWNCVSAKLTSRSRCLSRCGRA
jgi:hypothetical protein